MEKSIHVRFVDQASGDLIAESHMPFNQIPQDFSTTTTMNIGEYEWQVMEAFPQTSEGFLKSGSLELTLQKIEKINPDELLYTQPSLAAELPELGENSMFKDFQLEITEDDWRQFEFINPYALAEAQADIAEIKNIRENHSVEVGNGMLGFKKCHIRENVGLQYLPFGLEEISQILTLTGKGSLKMGDETVKDAVAIKTAQTTYYGLLAGEEMSCFCIAEFSDGTVEEIYSLMQALDVHFLDWYNADILKLND